MLYFNNNQVKRVEGSEGTPSPPSRKTGILSCLPLHPFLSFVHDIIIFHFSYGFSSIPLDDVLIAGILNC